VAWDTSSSIVGAFGEFLFSVKYLVLEPHPPLPSLSWLEVNPVGCSRLQGLAPSGGAYIAR
jgi:hypothetical protein